MTQEKKKGKRKVLSPKIRFEIFKRDRFTCQYCGRKAPHVELQVDHIIPISQGGSNDFSNLVTSCTDCNLGKLDTNLWDIKDGFGDWWGTEEEYTVKMFQAWMIGVDIHQAYRILKNGEDIIGRDFYELARIRCKNYRSWSAFMDEMIETIRKYNEYEKLGGKTNG